MRQALIPAPDDGVGKALDSADIPRTGGWADHSIALKRRRHRIRWLDASELADRADPAADAAGSAEDLRDHDCRM